MKPFEFLSPDDVPDEFLDLYHTAKEKQDLAIAELRGDDPAQGELDMLEFDKAERALRLQLSAGFVATEQTTLVKTVPEDYRIAA